MTVNSATSILVLAIPQSMCSRTALQLSKGEWPQLQLPLANLCAGGNIVSSSYLYGGTYNHFKVTFKKFGIGVKFVHGDDPAGFAAAIDENTKAIYVESIGNPKYNVAPIPEIAKASCANLRVSIPGDN
ncbi:Cys/Met metabolism PLP-dependent enzyme-domain-containing protein, partial [Melanogaster broomeanus]